MLPPILYSADGNPSRGVGTVPGGASERRKSDRYVNDAASRTKDYGHHRDDDGRVDHHVSNQRHGPMQLSRRPPTGPDRASVGTRRSGAHRSTPAALRPLVLGLLLLLIVVLIGGVALTRRLVAQDLDDNIVRVPDAFAGLEAAARPPATGALTFLVVGVDSRTESIADDAGGVDLATQPAEVMMVARINAERTGASVVSIPSDSWVPIPGYGYNKINAAYGLGGPPLLIKTVEQLTGIRVDHFGLFDFAGIRTIVDSVDGIDVQVANATSSEGVVFNEGTNHLDGAEALAYARQTRGLPRGDLDRVLRQQNVLRALLDKTIEADLSANPLQLYRLLSAVSRSANLDDTVSEGGVAELRNELRTLQPAEMNFLRAPVRGFGQEGSQPVIYVDDQRADVLWSALRSDNPSAYASLHPDDTLGATPP
jgi:LCP family protein required for cell wall assembly